MNDSMNGKRGLVSTGIPFPENAAGILIRVETTKTIKTMSILAIKPEMSAQRLFKVISWNEIFLGQNDIAYEN